MPRSGSEAVAAVVKRNISMSAGASGIRGPHIDAQMSDPEVSSPSPRRGDSVCVDRTRSSLLHHRAGRWPLFTPCMPACADGETNIVCA